MPRCCHGGGRASQGARSGTGGRGESGVSKHSCLCILPGVRPGGASLRHETCTRGVCALLTTCWVALGTLLGQLGGPCPAFAVLPFTKPPSPLLLAAPRRPPRAPPQPSPGRGGRGRARGRGRGRGKPGPSSLPRWAPRPAGSGVAQLPRRGWTGAAGAEAARAGGEPAGPGAWRRGRPGASPRCRRCPTTAAAAPSPPGTSRTPSGCTARTAASSSASTPTAGWTASARRATRTVSARGVPGLRVLLQHRAGCLVLGAGGSAQGRVSRCREGAFCSPQPILKTFSTGLFDDVTSSFKMHVGFEAGARGCCLDCLSAGPAFRKFVVLQGGHHDLPVHLAQRAGEMSY